MATALAAVIVEFVVLDDAVTHATALAAAADGSQAAAVDAITISRAVLEVATVNAAAAGF